MKKVIKCILLIMIVIIIGFAGFVGYVAKTAYGIGYNKIYDKHLTSEKLDLPTKQIYLKDYDFLCNEIKNNYVNLGYKEEKFNYKWDDLCQKYRKEVEAAATEKDFFRISWSLLTNLHDGHMYFNYTGSEVAKKITNNKNSAFMNCIEIRYIQNKPIIAESVSDFNVLGDEVISIDDIPFENIISTMISSMNNGNNENAARASAVKRKDYFKYFYYFSDNYPNILDVKVKAQNGEIKNFEIDTNKRYDYSSIKALNNVELGLLPDNQLPTYRILNNNVGYIRISTFSLKPSDVVKSFDNAVQELKRSNVKGVILDIRNNGGGNQCFREVLGYLTPKEEYINRYRFLKSQRFNEIYFLRPFYESMRSRSFTDKADERYTKWWAWKIKPSKEDYLRKIPTALIVNESIFSSTSDFADACLNFKLSKVIGNSVPLSGNGLATSILLPSRNYYISYGFFESREPNYEHMENVEKKPDIFAEQKLDDYYNGIDTQLKSATDYILNTAK